MIIQEKNIVNTVGVYGGLDLKRRSKRENKFKFFYILRKKDTHLITCISGHNYS